MPDQYFVFHNLTPGQALSLLAGAARKTRGMGLQGVRLALPDRASLQAGIALWWPDPEAMRPTPPDKKELSEGLTAARAFYRQVMGNTEPQLVAGTAPSMVVQQAAGLLLQQRSRTQTAEQLDQELLFVGAGKSDADIQVFLDVVVRAATGVRMALPVATPRLCLVHALDDPGRHVGGLRSLLAGRLLPGWAALDAFTDGRNTVFLPPGMAPADDTLAAFCGLVHAAPGLFVDAPGQAAVVSNLLFAVTGAPLDKLLYLGGLTFYPPPTPVPEELTGEFVSLRDSPTAVAELAERIANAQPEWGYRLDLRRVAIYTDLDLRQMRMEQLAEQIARLEIELANLESQQAPRPRLLRFTPRQLPALADYLRGFPPRALQSAQILYAYQAYAFDPDAGAHYLYVPPEAGSRMEIDPTPLWGHLDPPGMTFWYDPFWAHDYSGPSAASEVFVPEGTALFPPMHDWSPESMDHYLRDNAVRWFHGQLEVEHIPARPLYLFDRTAPGDEGITLQVLDRAAFVPLTTRMGWMNDNLIPLHAWPDVQAFWTRIADDSARQMLAAAIAGRADEAVELYTAAASTTSETIASESDDLMAALNTEMDALLEQVTGTGKGIAELTRKLNELQAALTAANKQQQRTETYIAEAEAQVSGLNAHNLKLAGEVDQALQQSRRDRQAWREAVQAEIDALARTITELQYEFQRSFGSWR